MRNVIVLLFSFAGLCAAQTSPTIVSKLTLQDQTTLLGAPQSPVPLYTPTNDGFFRMTMYISSSDSLVDVCHPIPPHTEEQDPYANCAFTYDGPSAVYAFPAKANEPIGYYTIGASGTTFSGSYSIYIVLERLY